MINGSYGDFDINHEDKRGAPRVRPNETTEEGMLNCLAAIQAAAEILDDNDNLSPTDRRLFLLVIRTETTHLHRILAGNEPA